MLPKIVFVGENLQIINLRDNIMIKATFSDLDNFDIDLQIS